MKKIILLLIVLFSKYVVGQTTTVLESNLKSLDGQWIWIESRNSRIKNPESEKKEIKLIIKECSIIEVYLDNNMMEILQFEIIWSKDKSINRNSEKTWSHNQIEYKTIKRKLSNNKNKKEKYFSFFTDTGTLDIWNNEYIELTDNYISGSTISKFKRIK